MTEVISGESVTTPASRVVMAAEGVENNVLEWLAKDPDEILDYGIDWANRLAGDTIVDSAWPYNPRVETSLMFSQWYVPSQGQVRCWLKGGEVGKVYYFTNRVTTQLGRVMDQTVKIAIIKAR